MDDVLTQMPGQPAADQILDKYIQAIGGAERVAGLKSYAAKGASVGFGGFGGGGNVEIFAKFPDRRAMLIEFPKNPDRHTTRTYDGREGWLETPLTVLGKYELTGGELDGARLDAQLAFPAQIKQVLTNWKVSLPVSISDLPAQASQSSKEVSTVVIGQDRLANVSAGRGPARDTRDPVFRPGDGPAPSHGALQPVAHRSRSHAGRLWRLSRCGRDQDAVSDDLRVDGWARRHSTERDPDQRADR